MKYEEISSIIQGFMSIVNWMAVVLVCVVLSGTVLRAVQWQMAANLAENLGQLPLAPWIAPAIVLPGYAVLLCVGRFQRRHLMASQTSVMIGVLEILASLAVIMALHMAYNSILLLVVIDMVEVLKDRLRGVFLGGGVILYVLTSLNAVRDWLGIIPFEHYLTYYNTFASGNIRDALTLMAALNWVGFIVIMVLLLSHKAAENDRVNQLNNQLQTMNEQLRAYAAESERMAETRERNRLAREIHDTLGHALTGIASAADACSMMIDTAPGAAKNLIIEIGDTARQGITDVRRSVNALRPDALEHKALEEALKAMTEHMSQTTGAAIILHLNTGGKLNISEDEEDAVYRIVQEGMTNAIRHGHATEIRVTLELQGQELTVQVKDNGEGMPPDAKEGFGLLHMRERLNLLGGTFFIDGSDGFLLQAIIPLRN